MFAVGLGPHYVAAEQTSLMPDFSSPENGSEKESEKVEALKVFDFGQFIAFVLPGLVATRGLALVMPSLQDAFDKITAPGEGAVGPLLWLILVGATIGLTISLCRQQWVDLLFGGIYGCFPWRTKKNGKQKRPYWRPDYLMIAKASKDMQALYGTVVNQVYRYYQFIGNIALAVALDAAILWRKWYEAPQPAAGQTRPYDSLRVVATVLAGLLLMTAYAQFEGWCRVKNQITKAIESEKPIATEPTNSTSATTATPSPTTHPSP